MTIEDMGFEAGETLVLRGELDLAAAGLLEDVIRGLERRELAVSVDLRGVSFMDRSRLEVILRADRRARTAGQVRRLLELTGAENQVASSDGFERD